MTLTLKQIYDAHSIRDFCRVIEIKRRNLDGSYETSWNDIEELSKVKNLDKTVSTISYALSNDSYNFGIVNVGNVKLTLLSKNGEFDDEVNQNSIFYGYQRHRTLIRIRDGFVDKYTDPENPINVYSTVFEGFIDGTSNNTKTDDTNTMQFIQCVDVLNFLLREYTISDVKPLAQTTLSNLIYEILNRSEFTDFFTVSPSNIDPGYDIQDFDIEVYEGQTQLFTIFENFSTGHSFFYVREGVFYYKPNRSGILKDLTLEKDKFIKTIVRYNDGISSIFERLYWQDSHEKYISPTNNYNRTKTINVEGCTSSVERKQLLFYIGRLTRLKRQKFSLTIPYYPDIFILDKIVVRPPIENDDRALRWDITNWDLYEWGFSSGATSINSNTEWLVSNIKHSSFQTHLILEESIL
jgi:hypothetical protein